MPLRRKAKERRRCVIVKCRFCIRLKELLMLATNNDTRLSTNTSHRTAYSTEPVRRPGRPFAVKAWLWKIATFPFLAVVYVTLIAEGLKLLAPELGQPLWRALPLPAVR